MSTLPFPMSLAEKYRPRAITDFVGLDKPKRILAKFAANPYASAWLFTGPPGIGETTMALALAEALRAELHHIPSQQCCIGNVEDVMRQCWYVPQSGGFHLVLVDEADRMSPAAQLHFLSKLDATAFPPKTIFVFTCNATDGLEPRFLSRTRHIDFSSYGIPEYAQCREMLSSLCERLYGILACARRRSEENANLLLPDTRKAVRQSGGFDTTARYEYNGHSATVRVAFRD